jgi:hypothetical protein
MSAPKFQPFPPRQQPLLEADGKTVAKSWYQTFQLAAARLTSPAVGSTPATSGANGTPGQILYDQNFLYVCIASNVWRRVALQAF